MPFITDDRTLTPAPLRSTEQEAEGRGFFESLAPAFRTQNTVGSLISGPERFSPAKFDDRGMPVVDSDFDPAEHIKGYERHKAKFAYASNVKDVLKIKRRIDWEGEQRRLIAESGGYGMVAEFAAGVLDPINLLPVGGAATRSYRMGQNIRSGLMSGAGAGALGGAASEAVLQSTQDTRTIEEAAYSIGGGAFLGGLLGGSASAIRSMIDKKKSLGAYKKLAQEVRDEFYGVEDGNRSSSAGAAETLSSDPQSEAVKSAFGVDKITAFQSPLTRTLQSAAVSTRRISQRLAENPLMMDKNARGEASAISVETKIKVKMEAMNYNFVTTLDNAFMQYRMTKSKAATILKDEFANANKKQGKLSWEAFKRAAGVAAMNGDTHKIPEVEQVALAWREMADSVKNDAVKAGLLPEDIDPSTALSYFTRVYNHDLIRAKRPEFADIIGNYYKQTEAEKAGIKDQVEEILARDNIDEDRLYDLIDQWNGKAVADEKILLKNLKEPSTDKQVVKRGELVRKAANKISGYRIKPDLELETIAGETIDRILSTPDGRLPYEDAQGGGAKPYAKKEAFGREAPSGSFARRSLLIPDNAIKDFLITDIEQVARIHNRSMIPDIELAREFGAVDMTEQLQDIRSEYDRLITAEKSEAKRIKLEKQRDKDIEDLSGMRDRIRGTYGLPSNPDGMVARSQKVLRNWNYLTFLGGMTVSAVADLGRPLMIHGLTRTVGKGLIPLATNFKTAKIAMKEVKLAGTALDMVTGGRAMQLADITDDYGRGTKFERATQTMANKFGVATGMAQWNAGLKQFVGVITMDRMLKAANGLAAGKKINAKEIERLAWLGIDQDMAKRIANQFSLHGEMENGIMLPQTLKWDDAESREAFRAAIVKEVDLTIVTPGQEKPLWMSRELGKTIGQFKSFFIASTQRMLVLGLQKRDVENLTGMMAAIGLGMLSYKLKMALAGYETSDDPKDWIAEGIDRSGLSGWFFEAYNMADGVTRGAISNAVFDKELSSRYQSRNWLASALGPSFGRVQDAGELMGSVATGEIKERDTNIVRRAIPYQNLFYLRQMFDELQKMTNETMGITK